MKSPTQQFIEDAIAGGWRKKDHPVVETSTGHRDSDGKESDRTYVRFEREIDQRCITSVFQAEILLAPLAWQAVGKTRGWPSDITAVEDGKRVVRMPQWQYNMHRFIDARCDGKTIDEALAAIQ